MHFSFKVVPGAPGLVSMLVLETRSSPAGGQGSFFQVSGFELRVSIPASTPTNKLLQLGADGINNVVVDSPGVFRAYQSVKS